MVSWSDTDLLEAMVLYQEISYRLLPSTYSCTTTSAQFPKGYIDVPPVFTSTDANQHVFRTRSFFRSSGVLISYLQRIHASFEDTADIVIPLVCAV